MAIVPLNIFPRVSPLPTPVNPALPVDGTPVLQGMQLIEQQRQAEVQRELQEKNLELAEKRLGHQIVQDTFDSVSKALDPITSVKIWNSPMAQKLQQAKQDVGLPDEIPDDPNAAMEYASKLNQLRTHPIFQDVVRESAIASTVATTALSPQGIQLMGKNYGEFVTSFDAYTRGEVPIESILPGQYRDMRLEESNINRIDTGVQLARDNFKLAEERLQLDRDNLDAQIEYRQSALKLQTDIEDLIIEEEVYGKGRAAMDVLKDIQDLKSAGTWSGIKSNVFYSCIQQGGSYLDCYAKVQGAGKGITPGANVITNPNTNVQTDKLRDDFVNSRTNFQYNINVEGQIISVAGSEYNNKDAATTFIPVNKSYDESTGLIRYEGTLLTTSKSLWRDAGKPSKSLEGKTANKRLGSSATLFRDTDTVREIPKVYVEVPAAENLIGDSSSPNELPPINNPAPDPQVVNNFIANNLPVPNIGDVSSVDITHGGNTMNIRRGADGTFSIDGEEMPEYLVREILIELQELGALGPGKK